MVDKKQKKPIGALHAVIYDIVEVGFGARFSSTQIQIDGTLMSHPFNVPPWAGFIQKGRASEFPQNFRLKYCVLVYM